MHAMGVLGGSVEGMIMGSMRAIRALDEQYEGVTMGSTANIERSMNAMSVLYGCHEGVILGSTRAI